MYCQHKQEDGPEVGNQEQIESLNVEYKADSCKFSRKIQNYRSINTKKNLEGLKIQVIFKFQET